MGRHFDDSDGATADWILLGDLRSLLFLRAWGILRCWMKRRDVAVIDEPVMLKLVVDDFGSLLAGGMFVVST